MTLEEYIILRKKELDDMFTYYKQEHKKDPKNWPLDMREEEWLEQELAYNFIV